MKYSKSLSAQIFALVLSLAIVSPSFAVSLGSQTDTANYFNMYHPGATVALAGQSWQPSANGTLTSFGWRANTSILNSTFTLYGPYDSKTSAESNKNNASYQLLTSTSFSTSTSGSYVLTSFSFSGVVVDLSKFYWPQISVPPQSGYPLRYSSVSAVPGGAFAHFSNIPPPWAYDFAGLDWSYEAVGVTSTSFYAQIKNTTNGVTNGRWLLRSSPASTSDANFVKRLPEDWVVYVSSTVSATGSVVTADGYRWYQVVDPTDSVGGWMAGENASGTVLHLPNSTSTTQANLEAVGSTTISSSTQRANLILEAVDFYYNDTSTDTNVSLYSSESGSSNIAILKNRSYPEEVIWGIAAQESGTTFDNEIVTKDYGHGIMQLTPYEVFANEPTSTGNWIDNTENVPANGSYVEIFPCRSYDEFAEVGTSTYIKCYTEGGTGSENAKPYKPYADDTSITYKWYSNTRQSIYANVKDGMRMLEEKFEVFLPVQITTSTPPIGGSSTTYSGVEREIIIVTERYNGQNCGYVDDVADRLDTIGTYFPGATSSAVSSTVIKMHNAGNDLICTQLYSPGDLSIVDSSGRSVGVVNGVGRNDFDWGIYSKEQKWVKLLFPGDEDYIYKVVGTDNDVYGLDITFKQGSQLLKFKTRDIPITTNEVHYYAVDKQALLERGDGVTLRVDKDGDGKVDETKSAIGETTVEERTYTAPPAISSFSLPFFSGTKSSQTTHALLNTPAPTPPESPKFFQPVFHGTSSESVVNAR